MNLTSFFEARAEIQKYFCYENFRICFQDLLTFRLFSDGYCLCHWRFFLWFPHSSRWWCVPLHGSLFRLKIIIWCFGRHCRHRLLFISPFSIVNKGTWSLIPALRRLIWIPLENFQRLACFLTPHLKALILLIDLCNRKVF